MLRAAAPDLPWPRLVSFGIPGGVPWKISKEELAETLAKYQLVERPPFQGPPFAYKTVDDMRRYVQATIDKGTLGHLDMHGVGADWHVTDLAYFTALLDTLGAERDAGRLWVASAIDIHKYERERDAATVRTVESGAGRVVLDLAVTGLDPSLYDLPLTLVADVPRDWTRCRVEGPGGATADAAVLGGRVLLDARPGRIVLTRAD